MAQDADAKALESLAATTQMTAALIAQLHDAVYQIHKEATGSSSSRPPEVDDALALARDAASLTKAHATKLSLLIINEPFTPSAVVAVLRDLVVSPVPGLAAAVEACSPHRYSRCLQRELAWLSMRVLSELREVIAKIPTDGSVVSAQHRHGSGPAGKGSVTATGVLWSACDDLVSLSANGLSGFFVSKAADWTSTLQDIMEELREWADQDPGPDPGLVAGSVDRDDQDGSNSVDELGQHVENTHLSTQAILDEVFNGQPPIPRSDPNRIRPRLESSVRRIRLVILLYQAISKRRFRNIPLPSSSSSSATVVVPKRLDEAAVVLSGIPDRFGDLACAFYDLEQDEIDKLMDQCFLDAFAASELLSQDWDGGRDAFTDWTGKFQAEIKKG